MSSGTDFPPPVRAVSIPKKTGGEEGFSRAPTVSDRVAQMVVKQMIEPDLEPASLPAVFRHTGTGRKSRPWML